MGSLQSSVSKLVVEDAKSIQVLVIESMLLHALCVLNDPDAKSKAHDKAMQRLSEANALLVGTNTVVPLIESDVHASLLALARAKLG